MPKCQTCQDSGFVAYDAGNGKFTHSDEAEPCPDCELGKQADAESLDDEDLMIPNSWLGPTSSE